jgi:glutamate-1-semialdehyde aminotransferase
MRLKDLMTTDVEVIRPENSLTDAAFEKLRVARARAQRRRLSPVKSVYRNGGGFDVVAISTSSR